MVVGNKPSTFRTISRVSTSTKATVPSRKSNYQGQDSNLHAFRHQILSLARLPIPPPWPVDFDCKFATCDCKDRGAQAIRLSYAASMEHKPPSLCFHMIPDVQNALLQISAGHAR